jgi:hypothetical protein
MRPVSRDFEDDEAEIAPEARRTGLFEALLHEAVRRAAQAGLSGFFATEDALRRAFSDTVPRDWADYLGEKGSDLRGELIERLATEFGAWLRTVDVAQVAGKLLEENDFELRISVSASRRSAERAPELSLVTRRK